LPLPPLSVTTKGPWNPFSTKESVNVGIFVGPARFTTIGSTNKSKNFLHIPFVGGTDWGVYIEIKTGYTFWVSLSTSAGFLMMKPEEVMPFQGD
jgi:hypothetical protein